MLVQKVMAITVVYILVNVFLFFFTSNLIHSPYTLGPSKLFDARSFFITNILVGLIAGILGGSSLVIVNGRYFRKRSFGFALLMTAVSYVTVFLIVNVIAILLNLHMHELTPTEYFERFSGELLRAFNGLFLINFILWGFITLFTLFMIQVNDKFGPGILFKFLMGNYHRPKKEERIFMFMDMRSSTTIAEKIGNEKYFNLLNDVFADLTDTIIKYDGEIYQYVGDEIVICWSMKRGIRDGNFIRCFLAVKKRLETLRPEYEKHYGLVPEFKAGIHYGEVMAGEIGVIKERHHLFRRCTKYHGKNPGAM